MPACWPWINGERSRLLCRSAATAAGWPPKEETAMRRSMIPLTVVAVGLLGLVAAADIGSSIAAQEATPARFVGHPFVGAWRMINPAFPEEAPILVVLHADGTYFQVDVDGSTGIGSWEATGER